MSIAPIIQVVHVKVGPAKAFDLFTQRITDWWPRGKTLGKDHALILLEPHVGGKWAERDAEGTELQWGHVLAWEPPGRLLLGWQLNSQFKFDPDLVTEVELTFIASESGGTTVTLEHRNMDRFGADADKTFAALNGGWPTRIADFARFADANA